MSTARHDGLHRRKRDPPPPMPYAPEMEAAKQQESQTNGKQHSRHGHGPPWQPIPTARQNPRRVCGSGSRKVLRATKAATVHNILVGRRGIVTAGLWVTQWVPRGPEHKTIPQGPTGRPTEQEGGKEGRRNRTSVASADSASKTEPSADKPTLQAKDTTTDRDKANRDTYRPQVRHGE